MNKRSTELDIAKGIGIIMVVWAHASGPFSNYITQFHMPFFFFISGMLYHNTRTVKEYVGRKVKSLLIPFWVWNLILYPVFFLLYYWKNWSGRVAGKEILEIVATVNKVPFLGATWFLPALFWVSILVHIFVRWLGKYKYSDILLLLLGIAVCVLGFQVTFPYRISRTLICAMYYICGYLYQKYIRERLSMVVKSMIAILWFTGFLAEASVFAGSLGSNRYDNKILFAIGGFGGIAFCLWVSKLLASYLGEGRIVKHVMYLGQNSIDLVIWQFLAFRIAIVLQIIFLKAKLSAITAFPTYDTEGIWWLVYVIAGIYGSLLWKFILEHNPLSGWMKRHYIIR